MIFLDLALLLQRLLPAGLEGVRATSRFSGSTQWYCPLRALPTSYRARSSCLLPLLVEALPFLFRRPRRRAGCRSSAAGCERL